MWVRWRDLAAKKNWYKKFTARVLSGTRDALAKSGYTIEETVKDEEGRPKRTGRFRLRVSTDDVDVDAVKVDGKIYTDKEKTAMKGKEEPGAKYMSID